MMSPLVRSTSEHVALYGGAFDPFTIAHGSIVNRIWQLGYPVWVMPCWAHKFDKDPTPAKHRWEMLIQAASECTNIIPVSWELDHQHSGSMYETLSALKAIHPDKVFHIVIGMDNANLIHKWDRGEKLIAENPFIVLSRHGYDSLVTWPFQKPHEFIEFGASLSSTNVRKEIAAGNYAEASHMVPDLVWNYIVEHQLYGYKNG